MQIVESICHESEQAGWQLAVVQSHKRQAIVRTTIIMYLLNDYVIGSKTIISTGRKYKSISFIMRVKYVLLFCDKHSRAEAHSGLRLPGLLLTSFFG